jgi:hypothetical protein
MKSPVLKTRREAMRQIILALPGGRDYATVLLGFKDAKQFDNHFYENSRPLSEEQIYQLEQAAGTQHYANYIAGMYDGLFVPVADPETLDNVEMYARSVQVAAKRGCVDQEIAKALADGCINELEAEHILNAHNLHMAARHAEVLAAIDLYRNKSGAAQ